MKRFLTLILTLAVAVAMSCGSAFASYKDVTDSYPASQEISIDGDPVSASEIPDGTYNITATTSSYMCVFSNVTITVENGSMAATFTCSKAYTRLYLGTAEEAAAQTNADGTDDSAYYKGTPADGYTPHVYTLPVSQLNAKMTVAAYAGATTTKKWYTRTAVFYSSDEVTEAITSGGKKKDDSGTDEDASKDDSSSDSSDNANGGSSADKTSAGNSNNSTNASGSNSNAGNSNAGSAASGSVTQNISSRNSTGSENVAERIKNASTMHAVEISVASLGSTASTSPAQQSTETDEATNMTPLVILLIVVVVTLALAALVIVAGVRISRMRKRIL